MIGIKERRTETEERRGDGGDKSKDRWPKYDLSLNERASFLTLKNRGFFDSPLEVDLSSLNPPN